MNKLRFWPEHRAKKVAHDTQTLSRVFGHAIDQLLILIKRSSSFSVMIDTVKSGRSNLDGQQGWPLPGGTDKQRSDTMRCDTVTLITSSPQLLRTEETADKSQNNYRWNSSRSVVRCAAKRDPLISGNISVNLNHLSPALTHFPKHRHRRAPRHPRLTSGFTDLPLHTSYPGRRGSTWSRRWSCPRSTPVGTWRN